jgi:LuxR family maltose regulon positive regulatory protein
MKNRLDKTINRIYKSQKEDDGHIVDMKMKILCFGNFEILWEGESLKWRTSKAEEFIAYLVHQKGEFVHKSKILEDLWPDKDVKQATKLLHTSVYYVRNAFKNIGLDGVIEYSNKMYKFDTEDFYLDTDIFEKAIKDFEKESSENIQKLKEGIKVYSGDYFEGNDYLWSVGEQGLLRNKYIDALSKISNYYIDQGSSDDAITYLKKITEFNPYDEKNHRKLLTAYINSGDLVSCKKHYKNIENEFKVELGEELSLKTKEIYSSIQGD